MLACGELDISLIKLYATAISSCHKGFEKRSVPAHPLIKNCRALFGISVEFTPAAACTGESPILLDIPNLSEDAFFRNRALLGTDFS